MDKIELRNFKIFNNRFTLDTTGKNMLVYGENGAGKSSIYEAIEMFFFHDILEHRNIKIGASDKRREVERFRAKYAFRGTGTVDANIEIRIDGKDYKAEEEHSEVNPRHRQCAMLSYDMLGTTNNHINFLDLVKRLHFSYDVDSIDYFDLDYVTKCIDRVNNILENKFRDPIRIGIEDDKAMTLFMQLGNLRSVDALHNSFNEARINLVVLLLYLQIIHREYKTKERNRLLVLDDIVTSLDTCNRTFLVDYILDEFAGFQLILFTHNVGFNNLFERLLVERGLTDGWKLVNMYIWDDKPNIYEYADYTDIPAFVESIDNGTIIHPDLAQELRKRFEAVVIELGKALQIGVSEKPNYYLQRLAHMKGPIYLKTQPKKKGSYQLCLTADDLANDIEKILDSTHDEKGKVAAIRSEIETYTSNPSLQKVAELIRQFNFHEKLYIHRLSHGSCSLSNLSKKEFDAAIALLAELKKNVDILKKEIGEM